MRHIGTFYRSYGRPIELTDDFVYKLRSAFHPYMIKEFESGIYTMATRKNWTASSARFGYWLYNRVGKIMPAFLCASSGSQVIPSTTSDKGSPATEEAADFTGLNWGYCVAIAAGYFLIRALFNIFIP
ncbi:hypothetical protein DL89DRAFT_270261 [Linderina pennispora]|uniref:Uncharacterized protein n=1 Tax=Linderina pennispora TaxID=61395 RepID=A0A1Y1VYJ8_9FUNG|nr:uncharacterized protein DL89DRAFT_270261 [Linderina pennispora]ORX66339.1 hypothetical protein DL89DRAFT_270261 [Linderina pennispora]